MNKEERILKYINTADELVFSGIRYYENDFYDDVENLVKEKQELKKQLTTNQILHRDCKVDNLKNISKIEEMENQQKEFIEYLENMLDNENDIFSVVRVKDVLSKYKEIIGVPMAGLDDEEEHDLFEMIEDMENKPKHIEEIKLVEIQNLWDRDIEIEKKLKEITKAVNYLLDKDKK